MSILNYFDLTWVMAIISIIGSILNIKKNVICFYIWFVIDLWSMILDFKSGFFGRAFLDMFQIGVCFWGIVSWKAVNKTLN